MKFFITFGYLDKNILFPILGGIFKCLANITIIKTNFVEYSLVLSIGSSLGMSLSFIFLIIYKCKNKFNKIDINNQNNNENSQKTKIQLLYNDQYREINREKYKFIFLTSIFDFLLTITILEFCHEVKINSWIFDIFFMCLFSKLFLKRKNYKHHYISMILIIIAGIILDISLGNYTGFINQIIPNMIQLFCEIFFSLGIVINKYTMEYKFASEYEICTYQGIFGLFLYIIIFFLSKYIYFLKILDNFHDFNINNLIIFLVYAFIQLIYNLCIFFTINYNSTCHFLIIIILSYLSRYFIKLIDGDEHSILIIVILSFILFMTLIFNEIIELNCCGLSKNTKKNISIRAKIEKHMIANGINDDSWCLETEIEMKTMPSDEESRRQSTIINN